MSAFEKFKQFIGIEDEYDEDDFDEMDDIFEEPSAEEETYSASRYETSGFSRPERSEPVQDRFTRRPTVVSMQQTASKSTISIREPITYNDSPVIIDDIKSGKVVVLNLEMLDAGKKHNVFDFVSGGVYAIEATMQKVTKDIFVLAPKGVQIDGKLTEQIQTKGLYTL